MVIQTRRIEPEKSVPPRIADKDEQARLQLVTTKSQLQRVNEWRVRQAGYPNLSEAVRRLLDDALDAADKEARRGKKG